MAQVKIATLVIAPVRDLMYQWHRRILRVFNIDGGIVGDGLSNIKPIKKFSTKRNGWQLIREGKILHDYQKTFVPDFTFRHEDGTEVLLEIVGFWTPEYLAHRRETLRQFRNHGIIIAVPEKSLREGATIAENVLVYKTALKLEPLMETLEQIRTKNKITTIQSV